MDVGILDQRDAADRDADPVVRVGDKDVAAGRDQADGDLIDLAIEDKLVDKSGAWINYGNVRLGQGRENAKQFLRDNPNLAEEISQKILVKRGMAVPS